MWPPVPFFLGLPYSIIVHIHTFNRHLLNNVPSTVPDTRTEWWIDQARFLLSWGLQVSGERQTIRKERRTKLFQIVKWVYGDVMAGNWG